MMKISHNKYHNGNVQSLGFTTFAGRKATVGVVLPGKHDFGIAKAPEHITVVHNKITINGREFPAITTCDIKVGDPIVFETKQTAVYLCYYDE